MNITLGHAVATISANTEMSVISLQSKTETKAGVKTKVVFITSTLLDLQN